MRKMLICAALIGFGSGLLIAINSFDSITIAGDIGQAFEDVLLITIVSTSTSAVLNAIWRTPVRTKRIGFIVATLDMVLLALLLSGAQIVCTGVAITAVASTIAMRKITFVAVYSFGQAISAVSATWIFRSVLAE